MEFRLVSKQRQHPMRETIETYDRSAEFFRREWSTASMEDKLTRFRLALHPGGRRVFDAGCGSGRDMHWLLERDLQVVGGDLSTVLLDIASRSAPGGRYVGLDLRELPLATASFDGVWACASLLHLPRSEVTIALHELTRVLQPGGTLFLGMKAGAGVRWTDTGGGRRFFTYFGVGELRALLETCGFRILELWHDAQWVDVLAQRL